MNLPTLAADKANHLIYGLVAYIAGTWLLQQADAVAADDARVIGVAGTVALGLGWEGFQHWQNRRALRQGLMAPHSVDPLDATATFAGGLLGWAAAAWTGGMG